MTESTTRSEVSPPTEATSFIGRKAELETACRVLAEARLLTVTGPHGVGKSRFSMKLAERMSRVFTDPAVHLTLHDEDSDEIDPERYRKHAGIIILDDAHASATVRELTERLLATCPAAVIVVTSTHRLGLAEERLLTLHPFAIPPRSQATSRVIMDYEAVRLLVDRIRMFDPAFTADPQELPLLRDICAAADGLPSVLELAAGGTRLLSLESVRDALRSQDSLIDLLPDAERAAQRADAVMASCNDTQHALLGVASLLPESVTLDCLVSLIDASESEAVHAFSDLVDRSILIPHPGEEGTFRMLRAMRQRGRRRLDSDNAVEHTTARIDDHLIELMNELAQTPTGPAEVRLSRHLLNHRPSLERLLSRQVNDPASADDGIRIIVRLRKRWTTLGLAEKVQTWLEQAVDCRQKHDGLAAEALRTVAYFSIIERDFGRSAELLAESREMAGAEETPGALPTAFLQALTLLGERDTNDAGTQLEKLVAHTRSTGRLDTLDEQMYFLMLVAVARGDHERAEQLFRTSVELMLARGNRWGVAYALIVRSSSLLNRGLDESARETARKALVMMDSLDDRAGMPTCLRLIASLAQREGDSIRAAILLAAAGKMHGSHTIARDVIGWGLEENVRRALGSREFSRLSARGRSLDRRGVLALALEDTDGAMSDELTPREFEIAELLVEGLSSAEIAARLVLSTRTVEGHIQRMLHKLQFRSRSQIAVWMSKRLDGVQVLAS